MSNKQISEFKVRTATIVLPCYNEVDNVEELVLRVCQTMDTLPYVYKLLFIDNASTDGTQEKLREISRQNKIVQVILNARNFGHIKSPVYGLLQSDSDVTILIASDLQDPPEILPQLFAKWEEGYKAVMAVKPVSDENRILFGLRKLFYRLISVIAEVEPVANATGAGLFDRKVIEVLRGIDDPYPYFRGLIAEIGFPIATVEFHQPRRKKGVTKNNFYTMLDIGLLGLTNHSKVPLRLMTLIGFLFSVIGLVMAAGYFLAKLIWWNSFEFGLAPALIGVFLLSSIQLMSLGIIGEYVGSIHTQVRKLPLVIESERINFEDT